MKLAEATEIADEIVDVLAEHCERITVAGSIRRKAAFVNDIEILFVPKMIERQSPPTDLFNSPAPTFVSLVDSALAELKRLDLIAPRPNKNGVTAWGPKNKLAIHVPSGMAVDFFATEEEKWWVSLVVRTGSKETNLALTTGAQKLGRSLNAYGMGVTCSDGSTIPATSERHVFDLCGVAYKEPCDR